jgi:hypothetical protein
MDITRITGGSSRIVEEVTCIEVSLGFAPARERFWISPRYIEFSIEGKSAHYHKLGKRLCFHQNESAPTIKVTRSSGLKDLDNVL